MANNNPTISGVSYQNPWSPGLSDQTPSGVTISCDFSDCPVTSNYVLVARLMQGEKVLVMPECSVLNPGQLTLMLPYPLADGFSSYVQCQFVQLSGSYNPSTIIASVSWTDASIINIPVLASILELSEGVIEISGTTLNATFSWANQFPLTAYVQIYAPGLQSATFVSCFNHSTTLSYNYSTPTSPPPPWTVVLRPLIPLNPPPPTPWPPNAILSPSTPSILGSGITYTLPDQSPSITSVNYDGSMVSAAWTPPAVPDGAEPVSYELLLTCTSNGVTTSTYPATSSGGTAPLPMPGSLAETYTVSARVNYGVIKGPSSSAVPVITGSVDNIVQSTDTSTGIATLTWNDISGFNTSNANYSGYTETFNLTFGSGTPITGNSGTSYSLTTQLTANAVNTVSVSVTATSGTVTTTGPCSPWRRLGTSQPILLSAEYDGTNISLSWQAMEGSVCGYTATLFVNGTASTSAFSAPAGSTSLNFSPATTISSSDTLTVTLQATMKGDAGPGLPTNPMPVSFTPAYFLAATGQTTTAPLIYTAPTLAALNQTQPASITLFLPSGNYVAAGKTLSQPVLSPTTSAIFTLAANPATNSNSTLYPYTLAINSTAWNTNTIRASVQTAYTDFLTAAETAGVTPWGISVIQEAIARHMPQTFAETLYYNYGLNLAQGYADLRPGMVLRVMPSNYMVVPGYDNNPSEKAVSNTDGYTNSAPIDYDIGSYTDSSGWMVGFDAFLSRLMGGAITVAPPAAMAGDAQGVAEAADLYYPAFQQPFYRVFFPTTLSATSTVSTLPASQINLAAAANYTALQNTSISAATNTYFCGRAIIKLCIRVIINGNEAVVPIGTTVTNILERAGRVPPKSGVTLTGLKLERAIGQTDSFGNASCQAGRAYKVHFDYQPLPVYGTGQSALDLPLLHGDILTFAA
ncbi:hypothetical protein B0F88_104199 [Methylobacter tundripaludum]|uniref:Uncharacterized protein n=1 Tax=Methylobacter tundripaludum TaxID=173365 RepID=A0A2S6H4J4_9GAMM|nr:hypothetical protein [Methylobacter tundripaludum]PPK72405.1 hypothetical protein B0F88_104199 [Methylobacter tundripaludum]